MPVIEDWLDAREECLGARCQCHAAVRGDGHVVLGMASDLVGSTACCERWGQTCGGSAARHEKCQACGWSHCIYAEVAAQHDKHLKRACSLSCFMCLLLSSLQAH